MSSALNKESESLDKQRDFPTILVVAAEGLHDGLVGSLRWEGYLVLEAKSKVEALHVVISQARAIHVLAMDVNMNGHNLARTLKAYRHQMQLLFVADRPRQNHSDVLSVATALMEIRRVLKLHKDAANSAQWHRSADAKFQADFSNSDPFARMDSDRLPDKSLGGPVEAPRYGENSSPGRVRDLENTRAFKQAV